MHPTNIARLLRKKQTREERQLWQALKAGRFAGFKFRRQHSLGNHYLDFYCPLAKLCVELDGFQHGMPRQRQCDFAREQLLMQQGIAVLRFWNHQFRANREGVLLEIWHALQERSGCVQVLRKSGNNRYLPPDPKQLTRKPPKPPIWYPPGTEPPA